MAPRLRELRDEYTKVTDILTQLKPLAAPPKHLLDDASISRFQEVVRDIFISADTPLTKNYLNFVIVGRSLGNRA
jgi:hypothetical protein